MIRTKIVATMGPACASGDTLGGLLSAGADVCRLNFSHGTLEDHAAMLARIREASALQEQTVAVLGDLCGPKIRLGTIADEGGTGGMAVKPGDTLVLQRASIVGAGGRASVNTPTLIDDVQVGDRIYIEDGLLRFVCTEKKRDEIACQCLVGGVLKSAKGINLPNTKLNVPSLTDKDWRCAEWAVENGLDYLALSFVRRAEDVDELREYLKSQRSDMAIIAKIEKAEAIERIEAVLAAADGLMVARGDLGVEMDVAQVPIMQKDLVRRCASAGKPVIVATQMLQSMIEEATPTRAEVSDVANAIFDGADAVMLSGETAVGRFPVGAVQMMSHVAEVTEAYLDANPRPEPTIGMQTLQISNALARGVRRMVSDLKLRLVVLWSQSGATARVFSKHRLDVPVIALSSDARALRRMALLYGVIPIEAAAPRSVDELLAGVDEMLASRKLSGRGERIMIVTGTSLGTPALLSGAVVHTVGRDA